jgi:hypothetical protein
MVPGGAVETSANGLPSLLESSVRPLRSFRPPELRQRLAQITDQIAQVERLIEETRIPMRHEGDTGEGRDAGTR